MKRPRLLGHRGARDSRNVPENTLASFELCLQYGCDGFEFDVRRSADGEAVICHDPVIRGMEIAKTQSAALGLPTLHQVLQTFAAHAFLDIELKVGGLEETTIDLLRKHPPEKGYVVSSFLPEVLIALNDLDRVIPLGLICERRDELDHWRELPIAWVIPQWEIADNLLIEQLRAAGKKVMVWTVNREDQIRRFGELGVDAVVSDEVAVAARVLAGP